VANWVNNGKTIWQSITDANTSVVSAPTSFPRWAGSNPGWNKQVAKCDGSMVTFKPDSTCLKFADCGDLKFSGADSYNKKADWQQP